MLIIPKRKPWKMAHNEVDIFGERERACVRFGHINPDVCGYQQGRHVIQR